MDSSFDDAYIGMEVKYKAENLKDVEAGVIIDIVARAKDNDAYIKIAFGEKSVGYCNKEQFERLMTTP